MTPRLALLLPQFPHDPASGAARNLRTIAQMMAADGFDVRCLGSTGTERTRKAPPLEFLVGMGLTVEADHEADAGSRRVLRFNSGGVRYELLDSSTDAPGAFTSDESLQFDRMWHRLLREFGPHVVLTYGAREEDVRRHLAAQARQAKVVVSLQNFAYARPGALNHVDAVLACSQFLADWYLRRAGLPTTPLPTPIDPAETIAADAERLFVTFVNPAPEKGLMFFARLAEELCRTRPDVPVLVFEGRGTATDLIGAGEIGGFDLRRHDGLMISPPVPYPRDIFAGARVLLAPSVWDEPAGRVAVEALVNGVPPIVSDRGGLAEVCAGGGIVLPLPEELHVETLAPVSPQSVGQWLDLILRLVDDEPFYAAASARATAAGRGYLPETLAPKYREFFATLL
jgi:glycosyltransferase involved in cell wall biosynthesis